MATNGVKCMLSKNYNEKRDFIRMKVDTPISIILTESNQTLAGTCIDLSGNGLLVELDKPLSPNQKAQAIVTSTHGHSPTLQADVVVSRVMKHPTETDKFEVAFEITTLA